MHCFHTQAPLKPKLSNLDLISVFKNANTIKKRKNILGVLHAVDAYEHTTNCFHELTDAELTEFLYYCENQVSSLTNKITHLNKILGTHTRTPLRVSMQHKILNTKAKTIYERTIRRIEWEMEVRGLKSLLPLFL